jgi:hypothetical protein
MQPRPFIYRSTQRDAQPSHPMRRRSDAANAFHASTRQMPPQPLEFKMWVYVRLD